MVTFDRPNHLPRFSDPDPRTGRAAPDGGLYNSDAVLGLLEYRALDLMGRVYIVRPISYRDGIRLQTLKVTFAALLGRQENIESTRDYDGLVRDVVKVCGRLLIPCGWRRRVRWLLPNPLRKATEAEIGAVLDFLLLCRTTGHIRLNLVPHPHHVRT